MDQGESQIYDHGDRTEEGFPWDLLRLSRTCTENVCLQNVLDRVSMDLELGGVWRRQLRSWPLSGAGGDSTSLPMSHSPMRRWMEREAPTTRPGSGDNKRPVSSRHCGSRDHRLPGLDG